VDKSVNYRQN